MDIFDNLCRCCNSEKHNILNLYQSKASNNTETIQDMLQYCLQVPITNGDKYPKFICYDCLKQLEISYKFIKRFQRAQEEFEEAYKQIHDTNVEAVQNDCKIVSNTIKQSDSTMFLQADKLQKHVASFENIEIATDVELSQKEEETTQKEHDTKVSTNLPVISVGVHDSTLANIACYICQKTFFTKKALNMHIKLSHKHKHGPP